MAMAKEKGQVTRRRCDLCKAAVAAVHCDSDQARLCWGCDARVHGANFLVARHARALLCRGCLRCTPWRTDGPRLTPVLSLCLRCHCRPSDLEREGAGETQAVEGHGEVAFGGDADTVGAQEEVSSKDVGKEEGEGENQVVPWFPRPSACEATSNDARSRHRSSLKRMRVLEDSAAQEPWGVLARASVSDEKKTDTLSSGDFRPSKRSASGIFFGIPHDH